MPRRAASLSRPLQSLHAALQARTTRDTLFMLAVIGWICLPHVLHLPVWCTVTIAALLLWRAALAVRGAPLPARRWLVLLLLATTAGTLLTYHGLTGRSGGVSFVLLLLALKTLEMRTQRDTYAVFFLGFFAVLCNFLYSQSMLTAAAMLLGALGLLTLLVNSHMPVGRPPFWRTAGNAMRMALMGAPITLLLFVFYPRIAPLWGVASDSGQARSGLSANMQVGNIASLALDGSVAMRIHFDGALPMPRDMYFRGPVLTRFDGNTWTATSNQRRPFEQEQPNLQTSGAPADYEVTLQATQQSWLPVLETTTDPPQLQGFSVRRQADLQWIINHPLDRTLRFRARSYTHFQYAQQAPQSGLAEALELPPGFNPRTLAWAANLRQTPQLVHADARGLLVAALNQLRTGGYRYTLEPGIFGMHSADEFWFDRKQGFCEHIASAFVVLMRALGVPARIVTGYQGGERNPVDGLWTVRQSDAHAWVEVWIAQVGWTRVDPTAAVAPQRTNELLRLEGPQSLLSQALEAVGPGVGSGTQAVWDAVNSRWSDWVQNYSQPRQLNLMRQLGYHDPDWRDLLQLLAGLMAGTSLFAALWAYYAQRRRDPWLHLLEQARQRLRRAGLQSLAHTPPRTLAAALQACAPDQHPDLRAISDWLLRMEAWRYAPSGNTRPGRQAGLATLRREYRQLHWPTQPLPLQPHLEPSTPALAGHRPAGARDPRDFKRPG